MAMQAEDSNQIGPLDKYLRPKARRTLPCVPQTAFRSANLCQQLLAAQLGWRMPPSLDTWRQVQARTALLQLQLPPVWHSPPNVQQRQEVCCLQLQHAAGSSCSRHSDTRLAAVGYSSGMLHIIKLADIAEAVTAAEAAADTEAAAAAAAGSQDDPGGTAMTDAVQTAAAPPGAAMPRTAALPTGCVWSVDLQDHLASCCWAAGELPELATAGPQGVKIRRFVEGRHHEYPLRLKGGGQLAKLGQVAYLDKGAAYTLAAAHAGGVVLWDCRAASRAVAELPTTASGVQLLQAMPGGTVMLTAAADGQLALYDVRRMSSNANSVINFGGSRASQQLIASFKVPARADEAVAAADGSSSLAHSAQPAVEAQPGSSSSRGAGASARIYPFFRDVALNPADPNLVAYVRPDLQVGLFDLYHNRVLQQVCVTEALGSPELSCSSSSVLPGSQRQAAARGCWDASGRVLFTHGLLRHCQPNSSVAQLQPTVAAVDFGSWAGSQQRRDHSSWHDQASHSSSSSQPAGVQAADKQQPGVGFVQSSSMLAADTSGSTSGVWGGRGGSLMCRGGQVMHLPVARHAAPTQLAAGSNGEVFAGTLQGDIICIH